jgi:transposase
MNEVSIIGIDLAKRVFQLHGAAADGSVVFRKSLSRAQLLPFLAKHPGCLVAMEACATSQHWGQTLADLGHPVRLIAPQYVKPFVKRQKNDMADAEAIVEAASRPTMRFVEVKSEAARARAVVFRARDLMVRQRTQAINALRGHLAEFGVTAPQGAACLTRLRTAIEDPATAAPQDVRDIAAMLLEEIAGFSERIAGLEKKLRARAAESPVAARLTTMPGVGPITALAVEAFAPPMQTFRHGRDFAAWLGLVPKQHSSGGKQCLGKTSRMGQRVIRRLMIIGAMAVVRWAARRGAPAGSWLARMLERKPRMVVAVALAAKMARSAWAMLVKQEDYRNPVATV